MKVVVVSGGLSTPSSTRLLADRLAEGVRSASLARGEDAEVVLVELRDHAHDLTDNLLTGFARPALGQALRDTAEADALVVVTPVFSASYSGLFKTFFDVLPEGALTGKPTLLAATAGSARHSLVLEHALRPLFSYLHALTVPTGVFAASEDWASPNDLVRRVGRAASELVNLVLGASPQESRDPFALTTSFADLV